MTGNGDTTQLFWVLILSMTPYCFHQVPTIFFNQLNNISYFHLPSQTIPNPPPSLEFYIYFASAETSSLQKSGMSSTTLPHTIFPSRNAASLTQIPPTLVMSSLMPTEPTALRPCIMPAEMGTQPP